MGAVLGFPAGGPTTLTPGPNKEDARNHIVAVKDGDTMLLYLNGLLAGQTTASLPDISFDFDVVLGRIDRERADRYMDGYLDEVALYGYALDPNRIYAHWKLLDVPEPLTMIGVLIGVAGLGGYVRRRRGGPVG